MTSNLFSETTRKASKTFYTTSLLFPRLLREEVFILYTFVRIADDLVDAVPPQTRKFKMYKKKAFAAFDGFESNDIIINAFSTLLRKKKIPRRWIKRFFVSQEMDLAGKRYQNFKQLEYYMYGVAEVIGLCMAKLMNLPRQSYISAQLLGRSMQLLNIIRDIPEDISLKRVYIPQSDLQRFGLITLDKNHPKFQERTFILLIRYEIKRFFQLAKRAQKGFIFIPKQYKIPIMLSLDLYQYIARQLYAHPLTIYQKQLKPDRFIIIFYLIKNFVRNIL